MAVPPLSFSMQLLFLNAILPFAPFLSLTLYPFCLLAALLSLSLLFPFRTLSFLLSSLFIHSFSFTSFCRERLSTTSSHFIDPLIHSLSFHSPFLILTSNLSFALSCLDSLHPHSSLFTLTLHSPPSLPLLSLVLPCPSFSLYSSLSSPLSIHSFHSFIPNRPSFA